MSGCTIAIGAQRESCTANLGRHKRAPSERFGQPHTTAREKQWRSQKQHIDPSGVHIFYTNAPGADVHKNETPAKAPHDTLRPGDVISSSTALIHTFMRFPAGPPIRIALPKLKGAPAVRALRTLTVFLLVTLTLVVPANAFGKRLIIDGSTAMLPLVQKLSTAYHRAFPSVAAPKVGGGQTAIGISDAKVGRVDIGDASRDPIPGVDPKGLVFTKVARDGVCVITNNKNPVGSLSPETVAGIFTGRIRDWSAVPGSAVTGSIDLFDRDGASGTQDAFQNIFLGENLRVSPTATPESSEGLEVNAVGADKSAIGFVSFAATINGGVHTVSYQGIPCTLSNAKSGQYGGVRNFWFVTKKTGVSAAAVKFINWVTKPGNKTARSIISSEWIAIH
jgi:phosphate transport system substrate-binding protein